jgi:hypothetical protein
MAHPLSNLPLLDSGMDTFDVSPQMEYIATGLFETDGPTNREAKLSTWN